MKKAISILLLMVTFIFAFNLLCVAIEKEINTSENLKVEILSPKEGDEVHGNITIEAKVNHPESVEYCEFYIQEPGAKDRYSWKDYSPPYFWGGDGQMLDTTMFDDGQASVIAYVYSENTRESKVQKRIHFTIDNGKPEVKIRSPRDHEIIKGEVMIYVDAGDRRGRNQAPGVIGISLYLDGRLQQRLMKTPFQTTLNTCLLTPGVHSIKAVGEDTEGLRSADSIVVIVDKIASAIVEKNKSN